MDLLDSGYEIYLAASGAGSGIQDRLWKIPGISKVLLGAEFPYAMEASDRFLGFKPEHYCTPDTAVAFAMESYYRGWHPGKNVLGLGLVATVTSNRPHKGEHRVHLAVVGETFCKGWSIGLSKDDTSRQADGSICDNLGMTALIEAVGGRETVENTARFEEQVIYCRSGDAGPVALDLIRQRPLFSATGKRLVAPTSGNGLVLFPGAFNPPHEGHFWMGKEHRAMFHITTNPPHKPGLSVTDILQRAKMLEGYDRVFTRDDPLYIDKARRFPGATFLVGVDAVERMLDPKWGVPIAPMLDEFRHLGIKFRVADREIDGKIQTLDDLKDAPSDLFERILRPAQHLAMSSTKVRQSQTQDSV